MQIKLLPLALLAIVQCAGAQVPPRAGGQIQQIPPPPALEKKAPEIQVLQPSAAPTSVAGDEVKFKATRLRITGSQAFPEQELVIASGFGTGGDLTLSQLRAMAAKVADYYHRHGYFVAQAYVPAQAIEGGLVTIAVVEGRYDRITLANTSRVSDSVANRLLAGVRAGDAVTVAPLERSLLLLSDLPGADVHSTLSPGATVGTSNLAVNLAPGPLINGSVDVDNAGNRYTGKNRFGGTVNFDELLGQGDTLTLRGLASNDGLGYGRVAYQWHMGAARAGVSYAYMKYWLGEEFDVLDATGTANVTSAFGSYPLIRRRDESLYIQAAYDFRRFRDEFGAVSAVSRKDANVWSLNVNGDATDSFGGGGHTRYSLTWTTGDLRILTDDLRTIDQATARTEGQYVKAGLLLSRLQSLGARTSAYFSFSGQIASRNLDISEKMQLGGANAVRAYPEGEAYSDEGFVTTLEGRYALPKDAMGRVPGTLSLVAFADYGEVTLVKDTWAPGRNHRSLSAAGLGVNWAQENDFIVRLSYAFKLGNEEATSAPDADGRFWAQLVKFF